MQRLQRFSMVSNRSRVVPIMIPDGVSNYMHVSRGHHESSPPKKRQAVSRRSSLTDQRWAEQLLKILEADTDSSSTNEDMLLVTPPSPQEKRIKKRRVVSFGEVTIREYQTTLSDHPMCSDGPPIGLDWSYTEQMSIKIDDYEADKLMYQGPSRTRAQMWMSGTKRWNLLSSMGHTARELSEASATGKMNLTKSSLWRAIQMKKKKLPFQ